MSAFAAGGASESIGDRVRRATDQESQGPAVIPQLNVQIPGLVFTTADGNTEQSSLLAQYIAASYRYLIVIAATIATIMFVWGAFLFLIGSALPNIQRGKAIMLDAVMGLTLVLSAHLILRTINPATLELNALNIAQVNPLELGNYSFFAPIGDGDLPETAEGVPNIPKAVVAREVLQGILMVPNVDACVVMAICEHETGFRPIWSGIQNGEKRETATSYGPCQLATIYWHSGNSWTKALHKEFPDFPLVSSQEMERGNGRWIVGEWFLNHPKGSGYAAALNFRSNVQRSNGNELNAVGGYGAGEWQDPQSRKKIELLDLPALLQLFPIVKKLIFYQSYKHQLRLHL